MVAYYLTLNLCPFTDTVNIPVKVFLRTLVCDYSVKTTRYPPHLRDVICPLCHLVGGALLCFSGDVK